MTMRLCWQLLAVAFACFVTPSFAEPLRGHGLLEHFQSSRPGQPFSLPATEVKDEPNTIMFALMSGKCTVLKVAGRDYRCKAVAYYQTEEGRGNFVVALDDPADDRHVITFSGENGRRPVDNAYELPIDRMLLKSKDRPRVDGLPVPSVEFTTGLCKQTGSFETKKISSISCTAADKDGKRYELQFGSDGSPVALKRLSQTKLRTPALSPFD